MASDWLFYYMVQPFGLIAIAMGVGLPFLLWRLILGQTFHSVGFKPLAFGYLLAAGGLFIYNLISSYFEFSARVSTQMLSEADRWSTVPGWTVYITVLSLIFVLPLLGLLAAPLSAALLRFRRFSVLSIFVFVAGSWLLVALVGWLTPSNQWHETHRLESLRVWLMDLLPGFVCVGLPFLLGIYKTLRRSNVAP